MTEVKVTQRSDEWFDLRSSVYLTSSVFGEAIGVGRGKPYDFLMYLLHQEEEEGAGDNSRCQEEYCRHGVDLEPVICEAYELLTDQNTEPSGFWLPSRNSCHGNLLQIGASPDAKVYSKSTGEFIGLAEFKAPIHGLYNEKVHPHGIPRYYMAQVQGQMAVCNKHWCDFMAVCTKTRQLLLKRVHFSLKYWASVSQRLDAFIDVLKEARCKFSDGERRSSSSLLNNLKTIPIQKYPLPGEETIKVDNLLKIDTRGRFYSQSGLWVNYDFLLGISSSASYQQNVSNK